jgi:DNA invertase Pin-like site-specific DNA recombinase
VARSLREGIDTSNAAGRMVAGVVASLAELELELGKGRRTAARRRDGHADSPSVARRRSIQAKLLWRSGCTQAVSQRQRLRPPSASAAQRCIA